MKDIDCDDLVNTNHEGCIYSLQHELMPVHDGINTSVVREPCKSS